MKFPSKPSIGQLFRGAHSVITYRWNGMGWEKVKSTGSSDSDELWVKKILSDINKETPEGEINDYNFIFKLNNAPLIGSEQVYLNGLLQKRGELYDYTLVDNYLYFNEPPFTGSRILCTYSISDKIEIKGEVPSGAIDDINNIFVLSRTPIQGTEHVFLNGLLQREGQDYDYTIQDNLLIFNFAVFKNSLLNINYVSQQ